MLRFFHFSFNCSVVQLPSFLFFIYFIWLPLQAASRFASKGFTEHFLTQPSLLRCICRSWARSYWCGARTHWGAQIFTTRTRRTDLKTRFQQKQCRRMEAAPYDNVEFGPTLGGRKPGTGTWPGPLGQQQQQQQQQHSSRILLHQPQTLQTKDRTGLGGPRLAPLEESLETPESHDQRMQAVTQQASSITSATTTTSHVPQSGFVGGGFSGSSCGASSTPSSNNAVSSMECVCYFLLLLLVCSCFVSVRG